MGVMLYKEGDKHEIRGVKCQFVVVPNRSLQGHLAQGWKTRVEDLYPDAEPEEAPTVAASQPDIPKFSATPPPRRSQAEVQRIRQRAKEAGIEGWDRRQVGKLEKELELGYS